MNYDMLDALKMSLIFNNQNNIFFTIIIIIFFSLFRLNNFEEIIEYGTTIMQKMFFNQNINHVILEGKLQHELVNIFAALIIYLVIDLKLFGYILIPIIIKLYIVLKNFLCHVIIIKIIEWVVLIMLMMLYVKIMKIFL